MLEAIDHIVIDGVINEDVRSEDVHFSPSGKNLAIATTRGNILYFDVDISARPVRVYPRMVFKSDTLRAPHGIDFLTDELIVVANRRGCLNFYQIPHINSCAQETHLESLVNMDSEWFGSIGELRLYGDRQIATGPGSVRIHGNSLYVTCNLKNTVTECQLTFDCDEIEVGAERVIIQNGIDIADGLAFSHDGNWLAISDHGNRRVIVLDRSTNEISCTLRDADLQHPHGLCFDSDHNRIITSDSGGKCLHIFETDDNWSSDQSSSTFTCEGVDDAIFKKTQSQVPEKRRALEGGIKGIDFDPGSKTFVTTCRYQMLRFFEHVT